MIQRKLIFISLFAVIGLGLLVASFASSDFQFNFELTTAGSNSGVNQLTDPEASEGSFIEFSEADPDVESFSFAAAGDFTGGVNAKKVFQSIADGDSDFTLALGDLGYTGNGKEEEWCGIVNSILGEDYPFQLIAGNHDNRTSQDGDIIEYRKCLPNRIGQIEGDYAIEYSFDYNNLARFIMISPDIKNYGADYEQGDSNYNWVKQQALQARQKGMKWVFLSMHKNCITPGVKECQIGEDILNLAIEAGVDVILQGHEHGYYRSKQLAFSSSCPAIRVNRVDAGCISNEGSSFVSGEGSVIVISGAGGQRLRKVKLDDPEIGYFDAYNGTNTQPTHGYALFDVSASEINNQFVGVNGDFEDSFVISNSSN